MLQSYLDIYRAPTFNYFTIWLRVFLVNVVSEHGPRGMIATNSGNTMVLSFIDRFASLHRQH